MLCSLLVCLFLALAGGGVFLQHRRTTRIAQALAAHPDRMQIKDVRWLPGQPPRFRIRLYLDRKDGQKLRTFDIDLRDRAGGRLNLGMHQIKYTWATNPTKTATTLTMNGTCRRAPSGPVPIQVYFGSRGVLREDRWERLLPASWRIPSSLHSLIPGGPITLPQRARYLRDAAARRSK